MKNSVEKTQVGAKRIFRLFDKTTSDIYIVREHAHKSSRVSVPTEEKETGSPVATEHLRRRGRVTSTIGAYPTRKSKERPNARKGNKIGVSAV